MWAESIIGRAELSICWAEAPPKSIQIDTTVGMWSRITHGNLNSHGAHVLDVREMIDVPHIPKNAHFSCTRVEAVIAVKNVNIERVRIGRMWIIVDHHHYLT